MKKKNGFTLIELLAIIVILAIIAVITVPIILNVIDNAEKGSAQDSAFGYKDALQKYYTAKLVQNPEQELPSGYVEISELPSDFTVSGGNPSDGWVKLNKGKVERYSLKYKDYVVTMDNDKNVVSEKKDNVAPHVPIDYQEVEYLESTGTQYIDTGVTGESRWDITGQYITPSNTSQILVGCGATAGQWFGQYNKKYALGTGSVHIFDFESTTKEDVSVDFASTGISATIGQETKYRAGSLTNNNYYLFGGLSSSSGDFSSYVRVYEADVYRNNEQIRQFVPVIRKSDNKPGMLDLANLSNNLFDGTLEQGGITDSTGTNATLNTRVRTDYIEVKPLTTYTISNTRYSIRPTVHCYDANKNWIGSRSVGATSNVATIQTLENTKYVRYSFMKSPATDDITVDEVLSANVMLNEGSTALPYESYGYKFYTNDGTGEFIAGPEL